MTYYAQSLTNAGESQWQPLAEHFGALSHHAQRFAREARATSTMCIRHVALRNVNTSRSPADQLPAVDEPP